MRSGWRIALALSAMLGYAALVSSVASQAATAPAPKPPTVLTGAFTAPSMSSVTLKGSVNPHGLTTVYAFQFGTTTGYGAQTAPVSASNGTTSINVSQTINGLPPGAIYHYRLIATNEVGTTDGNDAVFTTKEPPASFKLLPPGRVVFGSPFTLRGAMSGAGSVNRPLLLEANPFPYLSGFKSTGATTSTDAAGNFSFPLTAPLLNTQYRVVTVTAPMIQSPPIIVRVAVRVSLHARSTGRPGFLRMYGVVEPAATGASVDFQLLRHGLRPRTVAVTRVVGAGASASRFSRIVRVRRGGLYRAIVHVLSGKQVAGHSRSLLLR
ncbi:MAG TPA: hypothetical protein VNY31_05780 [Solirubrobacteraceae bacterium]|nr:hypothetical protein [Solirubrobacteraceae bacterium]